MVSESRSAGYAVRDDSSGIVSMFLESASKSVSVSSGYKISLGLGYTVPGISSPLGTGYTVPEYSSPLGKGYTVHCESAFASLDSISDNTFSSPPVTAVRMFPLFRTRKGVEVVVVIIPRKAIHIDRTLKYIIADVLGACLVVRIYIYKTICMAFGQESRWEVREVPPCLYNSLALHRMSGRWENYLI
jgi:hypothetical protein